MSDWWLDEQNGRWILSKRELGKPCGNTVGYKDSKLLGFSGVNGPYWGVVKNQCI